MRLGLHPHSVRELWPEILCQSPAWSSAWHGCFILWVCILSSQMFFFKACHSVGTATIVVVLAGVWGRGWRYIYRTSCIVTTCMQKLKIGSNNDFKHCSICCQLKNSAFELCHICSAHSSAVDRNYAQYLFTPCLGYGKQWILRLCLFKMKMQSKFL